MLKKAGKFFFRALIALFCIPVLLLFSVLILCPVIDNIALQGYRRDVLKNLDLPRNAAVVKTVSGCGNSSGTGNHTELVVGVLVRSEMAPEEFFVHFPEALAVEDRDFTTEAMGLLGMKLPPPEETGYHYYWEYIESAPCSELDLRGH